MGTERTVIARLHGGDFTITSTPSHGTKALITLA